MIQKSAGVIERDTLRAIEIKTACERFLDGRAIGGSDQPGNPPRAATGHSRRNGPPERRQWCRQPQTPCPSLKPDFKAIVRAGIEAGLIHHPNHPHP